MAHAEDVLLSALLASVSAIERYRDQRRCMKVWLDLCATFPQGIEPLGFKRTAVKTLETSVYPLYAADSVEECVISMYHDISNEIDEIARNERLHFGDHGELESLDSIELMVYQIDPLRPHWILPLDYELNQFYPPPIVLSADL